MKKTKLMLKLFLFSSASNECFSWHRYIIIFWNHRLISITYGKHVLCVLKMVSWCTEVLIFGEINLSVFNVFIMMMVWWWNKFQCSHMNEISYIKWYVKLYCSNVMSFFFTFSSIELIIITINEIYSGK